MGGQANPADRWAFLGTLFFLMAGLPAWARYDGGSGTAEEPYLIRTPEQMDAIGLNPEDWDKHFKLVADLDLTSLSGTRFHPVLAFKGVFDGNGHTIANLTYAVTGDENPPAGNYIAGIGLFRSIQDPNAVVQDLGLVNPDIRPASTYQEKLQFVGALAGLLTSGSIRNCYVEAGQVRGDDFVGGLVGYNRGEISNCHATGKVIGEEGIGGLVGQTRGVIVSSWSDSDVSGTADVGGLVGECRTPAKISRCHANGRVSGQTQVGGLVGTTAKGAGIADCFALGPVVAEQRTGGLVGYHEGDIARCYSSGLVVADANDAGGLVGLNGGAIRTSWAGGHVTGHQFVGGLVGFSWKEQRFLLYDPVVADCYARGNVQGDDIVGGLIGLNQGGAVLRCYATGKVKAAAASRVGGLTCSNDATPVKDSFWDLETSGVNESDGGTGKTTAEMQNLWTYIAAGWDFEHELPNGTADLWKMCSGRPTYPRLAWESVLVGDFVDPEGVDGADLAYLTQHWLQSVEFPCEGPDLNFDARVDWEDFALLMQNWQRGARRIIFESVLEVSPGWTAEGQWQFGVPAGRGGGEHGNPDPTGGYTGDHVYGVNLDGNYAVTIDRSRYLTAGPFDCRLYQDVRLQFARWLNTDEGDYVDAMLEMSTDGTVWVTVWQHEQAQAVLTDNAWEVVIYSLGSMADHQQRVYLRWGYGIKDEQAWPMSGWNIDDIVLTGVQE